MTAVRFQKIVSYQITCSFAETSDGKGDHDILVGKLESKDNLVFFYLGLISEEAYFYLVVGGFFCCCFFVHVVQGTNNVIAIPG